MYFQCKDGKLGRMGITPVKNIKKPKFEVDEQTYIQIVDHLFDGIINVDKIGVVQYASHTIIDALKMSSATIIGKNFTELITPTKILHAQLLIKQSIASSEKVISETLEFRNGQEGTEFFDITVKNLLNDELVNGIIIYFKKLPELNKKTPLRTKKIQTDIHNEIECDTGVIIEADLPHAIERDEFTLHYQPKVNLATRKVVGIEALIRWNHPTLGLISPDDFIPLAEKTGEIIRIGKWVLLEATMQNKKWLDDGYPPMVVSVNLSLRQFSEKDLADTVLEILQQSELPARYLELEITESMTANIPMTIAILHQLKALGVLISVDDFGTGYSTLNHLKEFPIDILKIDKSFILNLADNPKDQAIVKTIISLAHNLNLNVIAEGIEEEETCAFLTSNRCHEGQGYLFSKPLPSDELTLKLLTCGRIRQ